MTAERQRFEEIEAFEHVADELNEAAWTLRRMDFNAFATENDLLAVLLVEKRLSTMCRRYREDQHAAERHREAESDG